MMSRQFHDFLPFMPEKIMKKYAALIKEYATEISGNRFAISAILRYMYVSVCLINEI